MRKLLFLLLTCLGAAACDDVIFTDGRTIAHGYVTDSLTNGRVAGARVYLYACNSSVISFGKRCRTIIDSAVTDANGYYRFRFRDQRRTNFAIELGTYYVNDFVPVRKQPNPDAEIVDERLYLVREGKKNRFDFLVKSFKTVQLRVRINAPGYETASVGTYIQNFSFQLPARPLDTTLHFKAVPIDYFSVRGYLYAPDKSMLGADTSRYLGTADTTRLDLVLP
jgi:hypothetical protein